MSDIRPAAEIAADIQTTRESLIANLDGLVEKTQPERIAADLTTKVKDFYLDEFGGIRIDRAAKTVGALVAFSILRKLFK
jgi:hypothetical protein